MSLSFIFVIAYYLIETKPKIFLSKVGKKANNSKNKKTVNFSLFIKKRQNIIIE